MLRRIVARAGDVAPRRVDQDVDPPPPVECLVAGGAHLCLVEDVRQEHGRVPAVGAYALGVRLGGVTPPAEDGDADAPGGESGGETRAQHAIPSRHDGRLAGESVGRRGHHVRKDIG